MNMIKLYYSLWEFENEHPICQYQGKHGVDES